MFIGPLQQQAHGHEGKGAAGAKAERLVPFQVAGAYRQGGHRRGGRGQHHEDGLPRADGGLAAFRGGRAGEFAALGAVERVRVPFVPGREHAHGVAFERAVEPVAHAAVAAARARTARGTLRVVHTHAAEPHGPPGHAHAFVSTAPAGGRFALLLAGAEKLPERRLLVGFDVGILGGGKQGPEEEQKK